MKTNTILKMFFSLSLMAGVNISVVAMEINNDGKKEVSNNLRLRNKQRNSEETTNSVTQTKSNVHQSEKQSMSNGKSYLAAKQAVNNAYNSAAWHLQDKLARSKQWIQNQKTWSKATANNAIRSAQLMKESVRNEVSALKDYTVDHVHNFLTEAKNDFYESNKEWVTEGSIATARQMKKMKRVPKKVFTFVREKAINVKKAAQKALPVSVGQKTNGLLKSAFNYAEQKTRGPLRNKIVAKVGPVLSEMSDVLSSELKDIKNQTSENSVAKYVEEKRQAVGQFISENNPFKEEPLALDELFGNEAVQEQIDDGLPLYPGPEFFEDQVPQRRNQPQADLNNNEPKQPKLPVPDAQSNVPPVIPPDVIKKPTMAYYIIGGSLLTAGAALVYKAIDYWRLTGLQSNLKALDALIKAARANSSSDFLEQLYKQNEANLTLLTDQDKELLKLYLPEKEKFVEAAIKIKTELSAKYKEGFFNRISSGIKHDIKRVQGWSERALDAVKSKLGKVFKGIK